MDLWFWGTLFVLTVVAEIASQQLISIWFAAGSLVALIAALFGAPIWLQALLFVVASALLLLLTRPLVRKLTSFVSKDTNLRLDLGKYGTVVQVVDPEKGTGRVRVDDIDWIAVSHPDLVIPKGATVQVQAVDGTRLFVTPVQKSEETSASQTVSDASSTKVTQL